MENKTKSKAAVAFAAIAACCLGIFLFVQRGDNAIAPVHDFASYAFNPQSTLTERVQPAPDFLLADWRELDANPAYKNRALTSLELAKVEAAFSRLPAPVRGVLQQRLIGLYFVDGFSSSGVTDWVVNADGRLYVYMMMNTSVLAQTVSQTLTSKETTCFIKDDNNAAVEVTVATPDTLTGFDYILFHEAAHAVDYVCGITPFTEPATQRFAGGISVNDAKISAGIWKEYSTPFADYPLRKQVSFYGFGGPNISVSSAADIYSSIASTPFMSLYGSLNWAEDLAELFAFYHLTEIIIGDPAAYIISVTKNGKSVYATRPATNPKVRERFKHLASFYTELNPR